MKVEPRPLIPSDVRSAPVEAIRPVNSRQATAFEALLKTRKVQSRRSLRSDLEELTSAAGAAGVDSLLFGSARSLELLEHVMQHLLPNLDAEPQIKALAHDLISEEIEMRRPGLMPRDNDDAVQLLKGIGELYRRNGQSQRALVMLLIAVSVAPDDGLLLRSLRRLHPRTRGPGSAGRAGG
eukprot:gene12436-14590_t